MDAREAAQTLRERRDYLIKRAAAKAEIGWDNRYDIREATALTWALESWLEPLVPPYDETA